LFLALILMSGIRAKAFWRLAFFTPFITPLVATTTIWYWMFDNYHGLFNGILRLFHVQPIDWLGDPHWTLTSIIFYTTWKSLGLYLFSEAFSNNPHDGLGAAISVIIFLLVFTISAIQLGLTRRNADATY